MGNPLLRASESPYGDETALSYSSLYAIEQSINHQKELEAINFDNDSEKFRVAAQVNGLRTSEKKTLSKLSDKGAHPVRKNTADLENLAKRVETIEVKKPDGIIKRDYYTKLGIERANTIGQAHIQLPRLNFL